MQTLAHLAPFVIALVLLVALIIGLLFKGHCDDQRLSRDRIQAPPPIAIRRVCMDCGIVLEEAHEPHVTSHGLCPICAQLRLNRFSQSKS